MWIISIALIIAVSMYTTLGGNAKIIRVMYESDSNPYIYENDKGELCGLEHDRLVKAISLYNKYQKCGDNLMLRKSPLNIKVNFISSAFETIRSSINNGKADMAIGGITQHPDKYENNMLTGGFNDSVVAYTNHNSFDENANIIGIQNGSKDHEIIATELLTKLNIDSDKWSIKYYNTIPDLVQDLISGNIHTIILDRGLSMAYSSDIQNYLFNPEGYEQHPKCEMIHDYLYEYGNRNISPMICKDIKAITYEDMDYFYNLSIKSDELIEDMIIFQNNEATNIKDMTVDYDAIKINIQNIQKQTEQIQNSINNVKEENSASQNIIINIKENANVILDKIKQQQHTDK